MKENNRYIHIGMPKVLSTALQRGFFSKHPEILHLGVGCNEDNLGYINYKICNYIELYIRYSKDYIYKEKEKEIIKEFNKFFSIAKKDSSIISTGISSEMLSLGFAPHDVDVSVKAKRLYNIFGKSTKIIIFIRNQFNILQSLYKESVKCGYPYTFNEFMNYQYKFHCHTSASDLFFDKLFTLYSKMFGANNIHILPYEKYYSESEKNFDDKSLLEDLSSILGVKFTIKNLPHFNKSLDDYQISVKQELNKKFPHDISNITYDIIESHRLKNYFKLDLKISHPKIDPFHDVKIKRLSVQHSQAVKKVDAPKLYLYDKEIYKRLYKLYSRSNKTFISLTGLPLKKYSYPL